MIFEQNILQGRRYLVTGSTGGAGGATAILLSKCGGIITCMGRDPERTEKVRRSLYGGGHDTSIMDFSFSEVGFPTGKYDGIFHAAGEELIIPAGMMRQGHVIAVMDASLRVALEFAMLIGKRDSILKDGGSFITMSSVAAVCGVAGMTAYAASKGAIESLVRSAAIEWAPRRIRVNAIRAGGFQSPMHARIAARGTDETMAEYERGHPLGFGKSEDIANMVVYLMSEGGKWITGQALTLDGGYSCR